MITLDTLRFWPVIGTLLTLLWVLSYQFLPPKVYHIVPGEVKNSYLYADDASGGNSRASWLDDKKRNHWTCDLQVGIAYPFCGFNVVFNGDNVNGRDLSEFEDIQLHLSYTGPEDRIRVYLRNFNPSYSLAEDIDTSKFNSAVVFGNDLDSSLIIPFREFTVATWWTERYHIPRKLSQTEFSNITSLGIDVVAPFEYGKHQFYVHSISLRGQLIREENWYLCILYFWLTIFCSIAIKRVISLSTKSKTDDDLINKISQMNIHLKTESGKYKELSSIDPLTGAFNRLGFGKIIENLIAAQHHHLNAIIMIDIDHFKIINDSYGHACGDNVLCEIVNIIMNNTRPPDSVCRWGGEEFILLCPSSDVEDAFNIAEKIRLIIYNTQFPELEQTTISASFGISRFNKDEDFDTALKRADVALYQAKQGGRNQTKVSDDCHPHI